MMTDKQTDPLIGKIVGGKYQILSFVGSGSFGNVYKAFHLSLKKNFALKTLHAEHLTDETIATRFQHEAIITSRLNHPNIVSATDHGLCRDTNVVFIVMEYVEGKPLKKLIKELGKLDVETALGIVIQLCKGIDHAHTKNILHRDIKPSNILLTEYENDPYFVKISDFGIAKVLEESEELKRLTRTDAPPAGTYQYMAPEQFLENYKPNVRSDIYSIGCVLFEMLAGKPPYDASSVPALMHMHSTAKIPALELTTVDPIVKEHLQNIVEKALAKDPSARYASVMEITNDLQKPLTRLRQTEQHHLSPFIALPERIGLAVKRVTRRTSFHLSKLSTRNLLILGAAMVVVVAAVTMLFQNRYAQDFILPLEQRNIVWEPPLPAATASDRRLFEDKEKQFLEVLDNYRAFGKLSTIEALPLLRKFGYFYLNSESLVKAFQQFYKAEELLNSNKVDDLSEAAKIYLALAECSFAMGNYPQSISYAQKTLKTLMPLEASDYTKYAHSAVEALQYLGRAAMLNKNLPLAKAAFLEMYKVATHRRLPTDAPYFAEEAEVHAQSFSYAGSYFLERGNLEFAETFLRYAIQGWNFSHNSTNEAIAWNNLGLVLMKANKYKQAIEAYKKAESILLSIGGPQASKLGKVLFNEADAQQASGDTFEAQETRKQARVYWFKSKG